MNEAEKRIHRVLGYFDALEVCQNFYLTSIGVDPVGFKPDRVLALKLKKINKGYAAFIREHGGVRSTAAYIKNIPSTSG